MEEKIKKWKAELENIRQRQKEMTAKNDARIRQLKKNIQEAEQQMHLANNQMIADAVRIIYGDVTEENIERFRQELKLLAKPGADG